MVTEIFHLIALTHLGLLISFSNHHFNKTEFYGVVDDPVKTRYLMSLSHMVLTLTLIYFSHQLVTGLWVNYADIPLYVLAAGVLLFAPMYSLRRTRLIVNIVVASTMVYTILTGALGIAVYYVFLSGM